MSVLITITTFLTLIFSLILGIYTIVRNHKSAVYWLWLFTCLAVVTWTSGYLLTIMTTTVDSARMYLVVVYIGATFIPILHFHFITKLLLIYKKTLLIIGYASVLFLLYLNVFTNYLIEGVNFLENYGYYEKVNLPIFSFYLAYFLFYTILSIYFLIKHYLTTDGIRKKQILFITIAAIIGFSGGVTNFIMALTGLYPIGQLFVFLNPILITYGIFLSEVRIRI